jgi:membrane-associated phospholipid phosphatase
MIKTIWKKYKGEIIFIIFLLQIFLFYKLIQIYFPIGQVFETSLDEQIPFISSFVIAYYLYIPMLFLPFIMTFRNKKNFLAISTAFLFASLICNIIYMLFQTTIVRPELAPTTIFNQLVLIVYSIDSPLNLFPSEHVTFTVLSLLCLFKINKKVAYITLPFVILIVLSTLFIKQHHIPDVLAGLVLAFVSYFVFKKMISLNNKIKN